MASTSFLLVGIFLIFNGAAGRAIPDFYTDEDLNAWHKFGLRSFYGPWSVIARKPNGDFVSYADYGARVPSDFRPISTLNVDDDLTPEIQSQQLTSKYNTGISDFSAEYGLTPYGVAMLTNSIQSSPSSQTDSSTNLSDLTNLTNNLLDEKNFDDKENSDDSNTKTTTAINETKNIEKKRDTLELIGIVGVISEDNDSEENYSNTESSNEFSDEVDDDNYGSTTTEQTKL